MNAKGKFIVAKPLETTKSEGGVLIPVNETEQVQRAVVVSVGEKVAEELSDGAVKVDDTIIFDRNQAIRFVEGSEKFVAIHASKIIAVK